MTNGADAVDKNRVISSDTGSIASTTLTATSAYNSTYPNSTYATGTTSYVVGASMLGAEVSGLDADGTTLHPGYAVTTGGVATFYVTYPANKSTILTGCSLAANDTRALPAGSAAVYLVASAANDVTTIDKRFCFASISGWSITPDFSAVSGTSTISLQVEDGGDKVALPFVGVTAAVTASSGGMTVTLSSSGSYVTDTNGYVSSTITVSGGASGDSATVTYRSGDATTTVTVKKP